jgi:hypothetical protein
VALCTAKKAVSGAASRPMAASAPDPVVDTGRPGNASALAAIVDPLG